MSQSPLARAKNRMLCAALLGALLLACSLLASRRPPATPAFARLTVVSGEVFYRGRPRDLVVCWDELRTADEAIVIKRATHPGGPYTVIARLPHWHSDAYWDTPPATDQDYYYVVSAVRNGRESADSPEAQGRVLGPPRAAPAWLRVQPTRTGVSLSWPPTPGALCYDVRRARRPGGSYQRVCWSYITNCIDQSYRTVRYYYVVAAVNRGGTGPNSPEAGITVLGYDRFTR